MPDNLFHVSCVALGDRGVLLAGVPGSGKSDVALRLVDGGAELVSDDQTELYEAKGQLLASAPPSIAGLMEVRHVGLLRVPYVAAVPVELYVELVPTEAELERLPGLDHILLLEHPVRRLRLPAYAASTPAKICAALLYPLLSENPHDDDE